MNRSLLSLFATFAVAGCSAQDGTATSTSAETAATASAARRASRERAYVLGNEAAGNAVLVFDAPDTGSLHALGSVATGGRGSDDGLGSQGALAVSGDGRWLLAVDAGSSELSLLRIDGDTLTLADVVPSGGERPVSVTESQGLVYVLNAGGTQNVSGFWLTGGALRPIAGSTRALSAATPVGAAQVAFSPDGDALVVTEKATSTIDTFVVRRDGTPSAATTTASVGQTPFGFAFDPSGALVVSDAAGGAAGAGALSSYVLDGHGAPSLVTGPVADLQAAPCWVAVTADGRFAYTTNTASGTISGYTLAASGALALFGDQGVTTSTGAGSKPADVAVDADGRLLYVLDGGTSAVGAYRIGASGRLTMTSQVAGLPAHAAGLVVR